MRLDKLLANYGIGTRKEVKSYIRKGFVEVNGEIIKKDDYKVDYQKDEIIFDGELIEYRPYVYLMLNKPKGYVSATKVGRLDIDTEGLLLISNDGDFAHRLMSPNRNHAKVYVARIAGIMNEFDILAFKDGVILDNGYKCKPANLKILEVFDDSCEVEIEIFEGKFHQVKKMVEACNKKVTYLKRISIKGLTIDRSLQLGDFRELTKEEFIDLTKEL